MSCKLNQKITPFTTLLAASIFLAGWFLFGIGSVPNAFAGQTPPGRIEVRVVPFAEVTGENFTLGEIAELDGFNAKVMRKLSRIHVGRSPQPGKTISISHAWLTSKLRNWKDGALRLTVPPGAKVVRAAQKISGAEIENVVTRFAQAEADTLGQGEVKLRVVSPVGDVLVPKGKLNWTVQPVGKHMIPGGNRSYRVVANVSGAAVWEGYVRIQQKVFSQVVVAVRPIRRGQMIEASDLRVERKNISNNRGDVYLVEPEQVVGQQAVRPIGRGETLRAGVVAKPADVAEGGKVVLVYKKGSLVLHAPGVAMVKGKTGQYIPVRNLQSGKIIYGTLQDDETVRVE